MIFHVWTVLCSRAVIDTESNNISIQNSIEQLSIPGSPDPDGKIAIQLELVSFWTRTEPNIGATGDARVLFLQPSEKETELLIYPIDLDSSERLRSRVRIETIPIPEAGRYYFCVEYKLNDTKDWKQATKIPLEIKFHPIENE